MNQKIVKVESDLVERKEIGQTHIIFYRADKYEAVLLDLETKIKGLNKATYRLERRITA